MGQITGTARADSSSGMVSDSASNSVCPTASAFNPASYRPSTLEISGKSPPVFPSVMAVQLRNRRVAVTRQLGGIGWLGRVPVQQLFSICVHRFVQPFEYHMRVRSVARFPGQQHLACFQCRTACRSVCVRVKILSGRGIWVSAHGEYAPRAWIKRWTWPSLMSQGAGHCCFGNSDKCLPPRAPRPPWPR